MGSILNAQEQKTWQWVSQLGSKTWDISGGIACNSNNDLFVTGSFMDTLIVERKKLISDGDQDIFIARYNQKGHLEVLWKGGGTGIDQATCIAVSKKNNDVIIGGRSTGNFALDKLTVNYEGGRLFIAGITGKGKCSWISTMVPSGEASIFLLGTNAEGKIFASGMFTDSLIFEDTIIISHGKKDIFLARLDAAGNLEKLICLGGEYDDVPTALSASDSGSLILAGLMGKAFSVDHIELKPLVSKAKSHAFILGFNDHLKIRWKTQITGEDYGYVTSLRQDPKGSIFASGSFNLNIWAENTQLTSQGYTDGFLVKYDPDGHLSWARAFGTWYYDYASHLIIDNLGGPFITGSIGDTLHIDELQVNPLDNNSALAIQFSPNGVAIWADCVSGNGRNFSDGAILDHKGNLYFAGAFSGTFLKESDVLTSNGDQDLFLAKYYNCPEDINEISGDPVICPCGSTEISVDQKYTHVVWNDTLTGQSYFLAERPGDYTVMMLDKHGCLQSDTLEVTLAEQRNFSLGNDVKASVDDIVELLAPEGFENYRWQDNSAGRKFHAQSANNEPGTYLYWLMAEDSLGCIVSDSIRIEFFALHEWIDPLNIKLNIFPNPVENWLNWSINAAEPCQLIMELTNINGKLVFSQYIGQYIPGAVMKSDFSDIPSGPYYLKIRNSSGQSSESICIIRQ